ncbi:MAG TPA: biopolymer transporter ExbD [Catalimonadaceae bacterium]|nr:biopolymer transporter ExbD [Catalimonadaceae bacterium]HPI11421.1 biopolymer transporter ExbD [Catalimonadaceae bacterium]
MADIDTGGGKKVSTKVDMTPMVDLAFLLVTFFMLTTTFNKPQTMEVNMPEKTDDKKTMKVAESRTTTLVLAENNKVYYYSGSKEPQIQLTDFSATGLRKVLLNKVKTIEEPIVIIKAKKESKYKNLVDAIDEMAITGIKIYALVDITPEDLELLAKSPY